MALFLVTLGFRDADGDETERNFYVEAADQAAAETKVQDLAEVVSDVIAGAILPTAYLRVPIVVNPLNGKFTADAGSEVEIVADYDFRREGATNQTGVGSLTIPGFNKELYSDNDIIDRSEVNIVALETELTSGGWADYRGGDYLSVIGQPIVNFLRKK